MKTAISRFAFTASIALASAFIISCSGDDVLEDSPPPARENTYFYSVYGFMDEDFCDYMFSTIDGGSLSDSSLAGAEYSFNEVKSTWLQLKAVYGATIESNNNYAESALRNDLMIAAGLAPSQVNAFMGELNSRGNNVIIGYSSDYRYCAMAMYFEKE